MTDKRQTTSGSSGQSISASTSATGKENIPGTTTIPTSNVHGPKSPNRRARKALHATWSTPGNIQVPGIGCDSISFLPETPVSWITSKVFAKLVNSNALLLFVYQSKSLIGDSSVLFSPPSIIRETLPETQDGEDAFGHPPHRPNSSIESTGSRSPSDKVYPLEKNWVNSPRYYMWLLMAGGREVGDGGLRAHPGPGGTDGEGPLLFGHGQTWRTTTSLQKEMHLLRLGDGLVTSDLVLDTTLVAFTIDFSIVFHHSHEFFLYSSYSVSPL